MFVYMTPGGTVLRCAFCAVPFLVTYSTFVTEFESRHNCTSLNILTSVLFWLVWNILFWPWSSFHNAWSCLRPMPSLPPTFIRSTIITAFLSLRMTPTVCGCARRRNGHVPEWSWTSANMGESPGFSFLELKSLVLVLGLEGQVLVFNVLVIESLD